METQKKVITIYSTTPKYTDTINLFYNLGKNFYEFNFINAKSYRFHNYALENSEILILDNVIYTPDVKLITKYFKKRNIPILYHTDDKILCKDNYIKAIKKTDTDKKALLIKYKKAFDKADGIITSEKKLTTLKELNIFYTANTKNLNEKLTDLIIKYSLKYDNSVRKSLRIDFAKLMKKNNRKYRKDIFPHAILSKSAMQTTLISYNSQYKDYILKMNYKELLKAYKTIKKDRQPEIFKKFAIKLLKDKRPKRIQKIILDICKNPEYPLEEIMFYILKDIPSSNKIFKNKEILEKFIKEFCILSYEKDINNEIIFKIKDFDMGCNNIWESPDTYNIREFLKAAFSSEKNYNVLYMLLDMCKKNIISREELYYETYLLKAGFVTPSLIEYTTAKKYIKFNRICWSKLSEEEIDRFLSKTKKDKKVYDFLKTEKIFVYKPENFFIRIKGYGKNRDWARRVIQLTDRAAAMIKNRESFSNVLSDICFYTRQNALNNKNSDRLNLAIAGTLRYITPENCNGFLKTQYDYESRYGGRYSIAFKKFKDPKNNLKSPYEDLKLTRIKVSKKNELSGTMMHVSSADTKYCIKYIEALYGEITKYIGKNYTKTDFKNITKKIALLHWIIAHNAPWGRGSDSIANIFIKSILKSLNIKTGSLKPKISLDLEAFCTEYNIYQEKYPSYYETFEYIKTG